MITIDEVKSLTEAQCKDVLDFLTKQAYGEHAKICINKDKFGYNVTLKIEDLEYYLIGYTRFGVSKTLFVEFDFDDFTWKDFLSRLEDFVQQPNAYVSYLDNKPHLIDNNTSIEEAIINLDLTHVE